MSWKMKKKKKELVQNRILACFSLTIWNTLPVLINGSHLIRWPFCFGVILAVKPYFKGCIYVMHCALWFVNTDLSNSTVLLWEGTVFSWKYNHCIVVKPDRALCYNNKAVKHNSKAVFAIPAAYLQKNNHRVLTSTCSLSFSISLP